MNKLTLFVVLLASIFFSCEDESEITSLDYKLKPGISSEFDSLEVVFQWARAYGIEKGGDTTIISVYLEPQEFTLNFTKEQSISLGTADMQIINFYQRIAGYDFGIGHGKLYRNGESVDIVGKEYYEKIYSEVSIEANFADEYSINFELDIDESLKLQENNQYKFLPVIRTKYE